MRINHSLGLSSGLNANFKNQRAQSKTLEKLSTGLRINRASDDAAGLAISENLRTQVRGSAQARRNALDGISMLNIAEGGLNEIHAMLQRGRELSVQASSETLTDSERTYINQEVSNLIEEIDRVSSTTKFNGREVLAGGGVGGSDADDVTEKLQTGWLKDAEALVTAAFGLTGGGATMNIELERGGSGGTAAYVTVPSVGKATELTMTIDLDDFAPVTDEHGGSYPFYGDRIIAHEMVHAMMATNINNEDTPTWFKEGAAEFVHGGDERVESSLGGATPQTAQQLIDGINGGWPGTSDAYAGAYMAVRYMDTLAQANGSNITNIFSDLSGGANLDTAIANNINAGTGVTDAASLLAAASTAAAAIGTDSSHADWSNFRIVLDAGAEADTGSAVGSDSGYGGATTAEDIIGTPDDTQSEDALTGFTEVWVEQESFKLHIGANDTTNDELDLDYGAVNTQTIGIENVDVGSAGGAQGAIGTFDDAISSVSEVRSDIGSLINRLEHTVNNLQTSEVNQQAAESQIRDADFAAESSTFTKQQILAQSSISMIAQANGQRQSILSLIG